jgi:hypothetical protein
MLTTTKERPITRILTTPRGVSRHPSFRCSSVGKMSVFLTRPLMTPVDLRPLFFPPAASLLSLTVRVHRPNMGTGYLQGGRDYFRVNDAGEDTDTRVRAICPAVRFSCR